MKWLNIWMVLGIFFILVACSEVEARRNKNRASGRIQVHNSTVKGDGYSPWSRWSRCSPRCTQRRVRKCLRPKSCRDRNTDKKDIRICPIARCRSIQQTTSGKNKNVEKDKSRKQNEMLGNKSWKGVQRGTYKSGISPGHPKTAKTRLFNRFKCGVSPIAERAPEIWKNLRVIGGREAQKGSWPWQLALLNQYREPFCGATLIAPQWALTAAHCLRRALIVRSGEHNLMAIEGTEQESAVQEQHVHPGYDESYVHNDIALLKLREPLALDNHTQAACLPQHHDGLDVDSKAVILGWGKSSSTAIYGTDDLHQAEVPIVDTEECQKSYKDYPLTQNVVCAGYKQGRIDSCAGDSGGPLLVRKNGRWTLFGVTSFGDGCGEEGKYGIYSSVPKFVKWIRRIVFKYS